MRTERREGNFSRNLFTTVKLFESFLDFDVNPKHAEQGQALSFGNGMGDVATIPLFCNGGCFIIPLLMRRKRPQCGNADFLFLTLITQILA